MTIVGIILLILAVTQTMVGVLAWAKKLPGNPYIGVRVPEVRKSQEAWDAAHRIAGPLWTAGGIMLLLAGLLALSARGWSWLLVIAGVLAWLVFLGAGAGTAAKAASLFEDNEDAAGAGGPAAGGCCSSGAQPEKAAEDTPQAAAAPAPKVDTEALRRLTHGK